MKYLIIYCLLFLWRLPIYSQYIEFPTKDIYDTETMMITLNEVRGTTITDRKLAYYMSPIINDLFDAYYEGNYSECKNSIDEIFNNIKFYKRQYAIYSPLYYLRGMSLMQLGDNYSGLKDLVSAMNANSLEAAKALQNYFLQYCNNAHQFLLNNQLNDCLAQVQLALSTNYYNAQIYEIAGIVYEKMNSFYTARSYYRQAKKYGSINASEMLKQLKRHEKNYKKYRE